MGNDYIETLLFRLCRQPRTFEFISKNMSGLEPTETMAKLQGLKEAGLIVELEDFWVVKEIPIEETLKMYPEQSKHYFQKYMGYFDFLKTPHPLDFEWRNSTESLSTLTAKIGKLTQPDDKILILGMPTLFATAVEKDLPNIVTLIERNAPIVTGLKNLIKNQPRFRVLQEDIFILNPNTIRRHQCVLMDPPWYAPHFFQFMWLAAKCTELGGVVAISLPPINTRPSIPKERLEWFSFCESLGLCIESIEPQLLEYAMPFFEFNALRAAGIENILPFWRKGDFAVFRKVSESEIERPDIKPIGNEWVEREFKSIRLRIKTSPRLNIGQEELSVESIVKADILPTISSRDHRRDVANIWTSGNRIFKTNDPEAFVKAFDEIGASKARTQLGGDQKLVKEFIDLLENFESMEFKNYMDWIYYEMERQIV